MVEGRLEIEDEVKEILQCIENKKNFVLTGGAGSGKTYSLVSLIQEIGRLYPNKSIICITYTNNAVAEIKSRISNDKLFVSTIHEFLWKIIKKYQKELKETIIELIYSEEEKYKKFTEEHLGNMKAEWKMVSLGIGTGLLCDVITLIFSLYLISRGFLTIGQFMGFNILNQNIVWVFHSMPSLYSDWLRGKISAERISEFLSISSKEKLMKENEEKENIYEKSSENILKLEDIVFRYDENSSDILDKMNFEINLKNKEKILVTGESGCGKSTLIKILSGLYEPVSGIFKIDNEDVTGNRENITYVPQQTELFSLSLKDNLTFGRKIDEDHFNRILELTGLKDISDNLSDGLETEIKGRKDINLSAGQIQKIGLARALLSTNVKLLLMDEPIANLDTQSEKEISDILKNLEYSVVAVSHRNEVFKEYMKVYRMENGKIERIFG